MKLFILGLTLILSHQTFAQERLCNSPEIKYRKAVENYDNIISHDLACQALVTKKTAFRTNADARVTKCAEASTLYMEVGANERARTTGQKCLYLLINTTEEKVFVSVEYDLAGYFTVQEYN